VEHLKEFFMQHPGGEKRSFDRFWTCS